MTCYLHAIIIIITISIIYNETYYHHSHLIYNNTYYHKPSDMLSTGDNNSVTYLAPILIVGTHPLVVVITCTAKSDHDAPCLQKVPALLGGPCIVQGGEKDVIL